MAIKNELASAKLQIDGLAGKVYERVIDVLLWGAFCIMILHYVLAVPYLPAFWYDEAFMVEPAWHIATEGKSVSTLLADTPQNGPYGMNYPLFSIGMAGWIRLFGFSLLTIRIFPFLLTLSACWFAIRGLLKTKTIMPGRQLLLLLTLWMLTHGLFYASHQARPESLTMLVVAIGFYAITFGLSKGAMFVLFLAALLMPFCGLYMVIPIAIAVGIAFIFRVCHIIQLIVVLGGLMAGLASFLIIYRWTGAWESFEHLASLVGGLSIEDRIIKFFTTFHLNVEFIQGSIFWLLGLVSLGALLSGKKPASRPLLIATTCYVASSLLFMGLLASFGLWYGWLCSLPIMVAFAVFIFDHTAFRPSVRIGSLVLLALLLLDHNKSRYLSYSQLMFWHPAENHVVENALQSVVEKNDVVIGSESSYLTLRPLVKGFYSLVYTSYLAEKSNSIENVIPKHSAESITLIIADTSEQHSAIAFHLQKWCGGEWNEIPIPQRSMPPLPVWLSNMPDGNFYVCHNYRVFRRLPLPSVN